MVCSVLCSMYAKDAMEEQKHLTDEGLRGPPGEQGGGGALQEEETVGAKV